jgi:hypothetical protein
MGECKECLEKYAQFFRKLGELDEALPYAPERSRRHYDFALSTVDDLHRMGCISSSTFEGVKRDLEEAWAKRLEKPLELRTYGSYLARPKPFEAYPNIEAMVLEIVSLCSKGKPT